MKNTILLITSFLTITVFLVSCQSSEVDTGDNPDLKGTITVSGAWALYPMMIRWGEEFHEIYPGVEFDISAGGAGKGMADAISGAVDIGMVSREIHPEEVELGAFWIPVATDAVFLTINKDNPIWDELLQTGVSREQLIGVYITGKITSWGQLGDLVEVNDPIHVFTRSDACGAAATWAEFLGGKQEDLLGIGVYGDPGVLDAVIKDPLGMGFNNLNYVFDFDTGLPVEGAKVPPLDINANGLVEPEEIFDTKEVAMNAVALGYYPSPPARNLNLVMNGQPSGLVQAFIRWILTDGQQYLAEMGYIALPQDQLNQELSKLKP